MTQEVIDQVCRGSGSTQMGESLKLYVANLERALAFARCCILSGESWSPTCEEMIDGALGSIVKTTEAEEK